ncbi:Atypical/ALPHA protein kinase [Paramyrothecium foliicola]|nr:Atypical/ALPHA protein kinase [Paramyrothecium foliicola]
MDTNGIPASSRRRGLARLRDFLVTREQSPLGKQADKHIPQRTNNTKLSNLARPDHNYDTQTGRRHTDHDLWARALACLEGSKEDPSVVAIIQGFAEKLATDDSPFGSVHTSVKGLARNVREKMEQEINKITMDKEQRSWNIKIGHHEYSVRGFVEKTVNILNKFVAIGDVAVSFDPVHAALPWATVRFVLLSLTASSTLTSRTIFGLAEVATLTLHCDTSRRLYTGPDASQQLPSNASSFLENAIVQVYAKSLLFLGFIMQQQRSKGNIAGALFKIDTLEAYLQGLIDGGNELTQATGICEKYYHQHTRSKLNDIFNVAKEAEQAITDQSVLLLDMHQTLVLGKLRTAKGAAYDSHSNEHDPKCHVGTRVDLLQQISEWANDPDGKVVYWLQGMAGTGKSTISRTVAQSCAAKAILGASFFFKRDQNDCNRADWLLTTIAAQLVRKFRSMAKSIQDAIEADPAVVESRMQNQFEKLITNPLRSIARIAQSPAIVVIVIDALDECQPVNDVQSLIYLLSQTKNVKSVRLKFFVTSRPELHIHEGFGDINHAHENFVLQEIPQSLIERDISQYLNSELETIRIRFNNSVQRHRALPEQWPGQSSIQKLIDMSVPLFVFAATASRFIGDRYFGDPEYCLNTILEFQGRIGFSQLYTTYLPTLNQQLIVHTTSGYRDRSDEEKDFVVRAFRRIVGSIIMLANPLPVSCLSKLLKIPERDIWSRLDPLHAVLNMPPNPEEPVRLLHLSFRDFLIDANERSRNEFWIDAKKTHKKLASDCLTLLIEGGFLKKDICSLISPGKPRKVVEPQKITECLPKEVQYACLHWIYHLKASGGTIQDQDKAHQFLKRHFLHWLEALSLMGRIAESIQLMEDVQSVVEHVNGAEVLALLRDAKRFILRYRETIDLAPLQLYTSALNFSAERSIIRTAFNEQSGWIITKPIVARDWSPCLQTFEGHRDVVSSVAYSPNAKFLASGSADNTIHIWETASGSLHHIIRCDGSMRSVRFSFDSRLLIAGISRRIHVWDVATMTLRQTFEGHDDDINSVAISQDSVFLVSGSDDQSVKVWNMVTGSFEKQLIGHEGTIESVTISHDSRLIASGSYDKTAKIWERASGDIQRTLNSLNEVDSVAFSHDSRFLALGSGYKVTLWDVETGSLYKLLDDQVNLVSVQSALDLTGNFSCNASSDSEEGTHTNPSWNADTVRSVAFSTDSSLIAAGIGSGGPLGGKAILVWEVGTGSLQKVFNGHGGSVLSVSFSPDSKNLISGSSDETVKIWDLNLEYHQHEALDHHKTEVRSITISPNEKLLASTSLEPIVNIWDLASGHLLTTLKGHDGWVWAVGFSPDSNLIATGADDSSIRVWDVSTAKLQQTLEGHEFRVSSVSFSPESELLASCSADGTVKVWDINTGLLRHTLHCPSGSPWSLTFSSDSKLLVLGLDNNFLKAVPEIISIWDVSTGLLQQTLTGSEGCILSIAISPNSKLIAGTSVVRGHLSPKTLRVWDLATGTVQKEYPLGTALHKISFDSTSSYLLNSLGLLDLGLKSGPDQDIPKEPKENKKRMMGPLFDSYQQTAPTSRVQNSEVPEILDYGLNPESSWVTWNGQNVLWVPPEHRPSACAILQDTVVLGCISGRILLLRFSGTPRV